MEIVKTISPRNGHVCVPLGNSMLVMGGYTDVDIHYERYLDNEKVAIYHPEHRYWTLHQTYGDIPPGNSGGGACLLQSQDCILFMFGHTMKGLKCRLFSLDLKTFTWTKLRPQSPEDKRLWPSPRDKFCCWTYRDRFYCFGGYGKPLRKYLNNNGAFFSDTTSELEVKGWNNQLLEFDLKTGQWNNPVCKGRPPLPRAAATAVRFGSEVYIFGGRHNITRMNDLHCFDLDTYTWSGELHVESEMPQGRSWHTMVALDSHRAFLYGGFTSVMEVLGDGWLLDVRTRQWTQIDLPNSKPRLWHTCCFVQDEILVFGGCLVNILDPNAISNRLTDEVVSFHVQPFKLLRLCLEAVHHHKNQLESQWSALPRELNEWLVKHDKVEKMLQSEVPETADSYSYQHASSCTVA